MRPEDKTAGDSLQRRTPMVDAGVGWLMRQAEIDRDEWANPDSWGGPDWMAVYFSKLDSRTWVPKRRPSMGWTLNLAKRQGVFWLVGFLAGFPAALVLTFVLLLATQAQAQSQESPASTFPPVVVSTSPAAGDPNVDPSTREIRVTFSKDMQTQEMWSFVYANPAAFPEVAGPVRYVDARTCVLPVKLEPARTYGIWINSHKHDSFRDLGHRPAVPYLLVFETRGAPASR